MDIQPYLLSAVYGAIFVWLTVQFRKIRLENCLKKLKIRISMIKEEQIKNLKTIEAEEGAQISQTYMELFGGLCSFADRTMIPLAVTNRKIKKVTNQLLDKLEEMSYIRYIHYHAQLDNRLCIFAEFIESISQMYERSLYSLEREAVIKIKEQYPYKLNYKKEDLMTYFPKLVETRFVLEAMQPIVTNARISLEKEVIKQKDRTYKHLMQLLLDAGYTEEQLAFMVQDVPEEKQAAIFQEEYETILKDL